MPVFLLLSMYLALSAQAPVPAIAGTWKFIPGPANAQIWPGCGRQCLIRIEPAHVVFVIDDIGRTVRFPTDGSSSSEVIEGYQRTTLTRSATWKNDALVMTTRVDPITSVTTLTVRADTLTISVTANDGRGGPRTMSYQRVKE